MSLLALVYRGELDAFSAVYKDGSERLFKHSPELEQLASRYIYWRQEAINALETAKETVPEKAVAT